MGESRLQFTDAERSDPEIGKKVRRAEKAAVKADKAQAKIPTRKKPELVADKRICRPSPNIPIPKAGLPE